MVTKGKTYTVVKGDSPWRIAHNNNISLDDFYRLNPSARQNIDPGDIVRISPDVLTKDVNIREERDREAKFNLDNVSAIQNSYHDKPYVIIDKKGRSLAIFDVDNKLLYETKDIATGKSGNDYNTITYVDSKGTILNNKGNNSTPAGITMITGVGEYHGSPAFIRSRLDSNTGQVNKVYSIKDGKYVNDDIASSLHFGIIGKDRQASNGCVRVGPKALKDMSALIGEGTMVYTLPEKAGSKFQVKGGNLNFTADNPYGNKEGKEKYWDDYNVFVNKSYNPLKITYKKTGNDEYDSNVRNFAQSLVNNKRSIQKSFNLTSDEYNHLAELALGLADQESKFGTSKRYSLKQLIPDAVMPLLRGVADTYKEGIIPIHLGAQLLRNAAKHDNSARSRGYTQIKNKGDNKELQALYTQYGINNDTIGDANGSALATIIRLAHMYNTEVKGRTFEGVNGNISPYDALLYKWNGHNDWLRNGAIPEQNTYINNVKNYANRFGLLETRNYNIYPV